MIFQLSKGGTCWFCIGYDYVWLMFYGYINSNYIHELSKETVHTSVDSSNSFFLKENPCVSFFPSRCPSAINANVTNGGHRRRLPVESGCWKLRDWARWVELSWKRPVFRGWKLQTSWCFIPPNKKGYLGALGDLQMGPTIFREKNTATGHRHQQHSNVKTAVAYLPTFIQFADVYRLDY